MRLLGGVALIALASVVGVPAAAQVPVEVEQQFMDAARESGGTALLDALTQVLRARPRLAARPASAAALARAAAAPLSELSGATSPLYRAIADRIVAAAPAASRAATRRAVTAALTEAAADEAARRPPEPAPVPQPETPVAEQRRGAGFTIGSFTILPEVQIAEFYDDNIYATRSNRRHDFVTVLSPHIIARSNWARHSITAEAHVDSTIYSRYRNENTTDYHVSGEGQFDLSEQSAVYGGFFHGRAHEDRTAPDAEAGIKPTLYFDTRAFAGYRINSGPWGIRFGGTWQRLTFDDTATQTGTILNGDRDRDRYTAGAWVHYRVSDAFVPYVFALGDFRSYLQSRDDNGYERSSQGFRSGVGAIATLTAGLTVDAYVGLMERHYRDERFATVRTPAASATVTWVPRRGTRLTSWLDRSIDETTLAGASSYVVTSVGARFDQALSERLTATVAATLEYYDFQDLSRIDRDYQFAAGLRYNVTPFMFLRADYRYTQRVSSDDSIDFRRNQFFLRVGFTDLPSALQSNGAAAAPTDPGFRAAGTWRAGFDLSAMMIQFARLNYGSVLAGAPGVGTPIVGPIIDDRQRAGTAVPAVMVEWSPPGGMPGEVFGRFSYYKARVDDATTLAGGDFVMPFVAQRSAQPFNAVAFNPGDETDLTVHRSQESYDGRLGMRTHLRVGTVTVSPSVDFTYQRLNQNDTIEAARVVNVAPDSPQSFTTTAQLRSDYYQLGAGVGLTYGLTDTVSLFGMARASLDFVRSRYAGSSTEVSGPGDINTAAASDRRGTVSGRIGLRTGIAYMPMPGMRLMVAGDLQYVGAMPEVEYPVSNVARSTLAPFANGLSSARIRYTDQLNYGFTFGGAIRF